MSVTPQMLSLYTAGKISANDSRASGLIDAAYAAIRRYCGWHIAPVVEEVVTFDGTGGALLHLPTLRVVDVVSVVENSEVLSSNDFEWSAVGVLRRLRDGWAANWTNNFRGVTVKFVHGFEVAADIDQVVLQVVSNALSSPSGATREQVGALSVSWASTAPGVAGGLSLLARDYAVLDAYKLPVRL